MFKIIANPTFPAPVTIRAPGGAESAFNGEFKHLDQEAFADFIKRSQEPGRDDVETLLEVLVGWDEVDAEFTEENLRLLLAQYHGVGKAGAGYAIYQAYVNEYTGALLGN